MSTICGLLIGLIIIAMPALSISVLIRYLMKKPFKKLGKITLYCLLAIVPLMVLGILTDPATWEEDENITTSITSTTTTTVSTTSGQGSHNPPEDLPQSSTTTTTTTTTTTGSQGSQNPPEDVTTTTIPTTTTTTGSQGSQNLH